MRGRKTKGIVGKQRQKHLQEAKQREAPSSGRRCRLLSMSLEKEGAEQVWRASSSFKGYSQSRGIGCMCRRLSSARLRQVWEEGGHVDMGVNPGMFFKVNRTISFLSQGVSAVSGAELWSSCPRCKSLLGAQASVQDGRL